MKFIRPVAFCLCVSALASCQKSDLKEPPVPLGDFALGLNIVVADNVQKVPISRDASPDEWEAAMKRAVQDRFGRYDGSKLYNIGISIDGYALAPPGIPIVMAPKSILVITANIWDDAAQTKLNAEGQRITVFESLSGDTVIGTGLTRNKAQQMDALSYNAVKKIEEWLVKNPAWFGISGAALPVDPDAPSVAPLVTDDLPGPAPRPGR
jgi:hypothetical protein